MDECIIKYYVNEVNAIRKALLFYRRPVLLAQGSSLAESAGSGSYQTIYGIASNNDKSATPIYVRPISKLQKEKMFPGLKILSAAELLAEAVRRNYENRSISSLFD